jgi:hypothetical protein
MYPMNHCLLSIPYLNSNNVKINFIENLNYTYLIIHFNWNRLNFKLLQGLNR